MLLVDLFNSLDWSRLDNIFSAVASATVLAGIVWAAIKFLWNPLFNRLTRRRAQAKLLDKLACGSSVGFVEALIGVAQFISKQDDREHRTYHLPGAWVQIDVKDEMVRAFSVTITKRRMYYVTKRLTYGYLKVKLGMSKFGPHGIGYDGERLWIGAYRCGYLRTYDFRRSGASQRFFLSYNMAGVGTFGVKDPSSTDDTPHAYSTGVYAREGMTYETHPVDPGLDASTCTINTLTVVHPEADHAEFLRSDILGPDEAHVKMASAIKPPHQNKLRDRLRYRVYQAKQLISGPFRPDGR